MGPVLILGWGVLFFFNEALCVGTPAASGLIQTNQGADFHAER